MAESGIIESALGGESEAAEEQQAPASGDAVAVAAALDAASRDTAAAAQAAEFLHAQRRLVELQVKHFEVERHIAVAAAGRKRYADYLRNGMATAVFVLLAAVVTGFAWMVWQAAHDRGLLVEPFSVPPDLAARGLTGQVVATQLLDQIADMEAQTRSNRAANTYQNDWGNDLRVEIPETGVSLGEVRRLLRESLGHPTRISGEVFRGGDVLTIGVRAGEQGGKEFSGSDAQWTALVHRAAEEAYRRTQPYRYGVYLMLSDRVDEGEAVHRDLASSPDATERAWAHNGLGAQFLTTGDSAGAASEFRKALVDLPSHALARANLAKAELYNGHDQAALKLVDELSGDTAAIDSDIAPAVRSAFSENRASTAALLRGDYPEAMRQIEKIPETGDIVAATRPLALARAVTLWMLHDLDGAATAISVYPANLGARVTIEGLIALSRHDRRALDLLTAVHDGAGMFLQDSRYRSVHWYVPDSGAPWLALARAQFGDIAGARALIEPTPADCYVCVRVRGQIEALARDSSVAERWFAEAIQLAPELPIARTERGFARLAFGDAERAQQDAAEAVRLSPHNGDAWKLWGDVLAKQGNRKDALAKYDEALKYAPKWQELQVARAAVAGT